MAHDDESHFFSYHFMLKLVFDDVMRW